MYPSPDRCYNKEMHLMLYWGRDTVTAGLDQLGRNGTSQDRSEATNCAASLNHDDVGFRAALRSVI